MDVKGREGLEGKAEEEGQQADRLRVARLQSKATIPWAFASAAERNSTAKVTNPIAATGLDAIRINPSEVGYYLRTAELLEQERDHASARALIELGMNHFDEPPLELCESLQRNYAILNLSDRPQMRGCVKIIDIR